MRKEYHVILVLLHLNSRWSLIGCHGYHVSGQVVSSQADSEEEWKIIRASGSGSEGKESSPPPEIISLPREDSPGFNKVSLSVRLPSWNQLIGLVN